jgi:hypothetical protein
VGLCCFNPCNMLNANICALYINIIRQIIKVKITVEMDGSFIVWVKKFILILILFQ